MKRFLFDMPVTDANGTQTFYVDAETPEQALEALNSGDYDGGIYDEEIEVMALGEASYAGETTLDDEGPLGARVFDVSITIPGSAITCGKGCDCLVQCGDVYAHAKDTQIRTFHLLTTLFLTNLIERCEHGDINEECEDEDWRAIYIEAKQMLAQLKDLK